ncbi:alkaline phosphatase PhoX [Caulobacter sp. 17J65-9]|uniref:alkaline phosphatase PhoX n=1 Tax=Caulobacter sp. 17J65-9 TaxID=2709382 RepID=UPI0013C76963|nr:alkaline phosphatase PhoX [Caulobacter sp. 17J65-9]NEX92094.1 DUF839 domain-containing protein [Caulobacter sp. 17J65-9]
MSFSRRSFLSAGIAFAGYASFARAQDKGDPGYTSEVAGYGPLVEDPAKVFDLPEGFSYRVVSQAGETMSDGLYVPHKADGMGCFPLGRDKVVLVRNHELRPADVNHGALGVSSHSPLRLPKERIYDFNDRGQPLPGGTTTLVYDLRKQRLERQHLSLIGTSTNCAGGQTPWGSWLTCEETVQHAGSGVGKDHGWVFEVPASAKGLVDPRPLTAMGRFKHEAACVDPRTGAVYMTEDESSDLKGLFYRFLPNTPGELHKGGRLQALAFRDAPEGGDSRNQDGVTTWNPGDWKDVFWVDLDGVDNPHDDLRMRGHAAGAAWFSRGEGVHFGNGELYFCCTSGGKHGQIMRYVPSPHEGRPEEKDAPGRIQLFVQPEDPKVFDYGDNLTIAPWGHLIVCEDRYSDNLRNHLRGVTPDGKIYTIGRNVFRENAELAGVCFSPDGTTMFVNIYWPGVTLAITGPWDRLRA